jgi:hypothetical protein
MSETTPNLNLRIPRQQELPHPYNSRTVHRLEASTVTRLESITDVTPPPTPQIGDCYFVTVGQDLWAGLSGVIVHWTGGAWESWEPQQGIVAWVVPDQANKTYLSGQWVDFSDTTIIQSQFNVYRPGTFGFFGPLRYDRFGTNSQVHSGFGMLFDRLDHLFVPNAIGLETSVQVGNTTTYTSSRDLEVGQKYALYRYVGARAVATGTIPARMPKLLSIDVRVDGDTSVCYLSTAPTLIFSPARPAPHGGQAAGDEVYARDIDTWQHRPQNTYYSGGGYPVSNANDIRNVRHLYQENLCCKETDDIVLTLDPVQETDPGVGPGYEFTHVTSRSGINLQLGPGTLWLAFARGPQIYGDGPQYDTVANRVLFDVSVSMTVSSDF